MINFAYGAPSLMAKNMTTCIMTFLLTFSLWVNISHAEGLSIVELRQVLEALKPGERFEIPSGVYHGRIRLSLQGTSDQPIVIDGLDQALISGEKCTDFDEGEMTPLLDLVDCKHLVVKNLRLGQYETKVKGCIPVGILISGVSSDVTVQDCDIFDISQDYWNGKSNNLGEFCYRDAHAIAVYGREKEPITDCYILGNRIHNCRLGSSETLVINGNVEGWRIEDNHIFDCDNIGIDIIGHEGIAPDPELDVARKGVIKGNRVHGIKTMGNKAYTSKSETSGYDACAAGIYIDGGKAVEILDNIVYDCDIGIELSSEHGGKSSSHVLVKGNTVYENGQCGLALGASTQRQGRLYDIKVMENTFCDNGYLGWGMGEISFQFNIERVEIVKNILSSKAHKPDDQFCRFIRFKKMMPRECIIDFNTYYSPLKEALHWGQGYKKSKYHASTFLKWQKMGFDASGQMKRAESASRLLIKNARQSKGG
jgi:hypothetical protein